jgi:hypothetical protein
MWPWKSRVECHSEFEPPPQETILQSKILFLGAFFLHGRSEKSLGARSGEQGGYGAFSSRYWLSLFVTCGLVLPACTINFLRSLALRRAPISGRIWSIECWLIHFCHLGITLIKWNLYGFHTTVSIVFGLLIVWHSIGCGSLWSGSQICSCWFEK